MLEITTTNQHNLKKHDFKSQKLNSALVIFLGLFGIQTLATAWCFFYRLSWEFTVTLILISITGFLLESVGIRKKSVSANDEIVSNSTVPQHQNTVREYLSRLGLQSRCWVKLLVSTVVLLSIAYVTSGTPSFIEKVLARKGDQGFEFVDDL